MTALPVLRNKRVLVIEDNGILCMGLLDLLQTAGCTVIGPYAWLHDAMSTVASLRIDAAILDTNLHGVLVTPLAQYLSQRGIPFFLASAYQVSDMPVELRAMQCVHKPYADTDILRALAGLFGPQPLASA